MKKIIFTLGIILLLVSICAVSLYSYLSPEQRVQPVADKSTLRQTESGDVVGFTNEGVSAWLGIPYAQAPVGDLRWRAPNHVEISPKARDALAFGSACPQYSGANLRGNEDCLFLNIWSPQSTGTSSHPVMFWIHGGGNSIGEAATTIYNGARLSREHNIVLVSINYRLGPLGWFRHPALNDEKSTAADQSGNFGTLDIIMALRWVHNNIAAFYGDPGNVTIFGESAGGFDVLTMMASPLAEGLFHKAISQSGGLNLTPVSVAENFKDDDRPGHNLSSAEIINTLLIREGQASNRSEAKSRQQEMRPEELADLLITLTPKELLSLYSGSFGGMLGNPDIFADGHVLPAVEDSIELFSDVKTYNEVPVILGTNRDEAKLFMAFSSAAVSKTFGLPSGFNSLATYNRDNRYATDGWKIRAVDDLAIAMKSAQKEGVYTYRFDVDDWRDVGLIELKDLFGAAHAMELPFVFGNFPKPMRVIFPDAMRDEFEIVSRHMRSYWAEFAYSGSPGQGRSGDLITWNSWTNPPDSTPGLMVFDTESDQGIRMIDEKISTSDLRKRFLADTSYGSQDQYCSAYKRVFSGKNFDADEYAKLGETGCSD
jgi:para-nitrobenzyl esterase